MDSTKSAIVIAALDLTRAVAAATCHPFILSKLGKKLSIIMGFLVGSIGIVGTGAIGFIPSDMW